jgi:Kef-type K+ transport system membrane component KefB
MALVLVLSLVMLARHVGGDGDGKFATMALGFILIVAALVGEAGEHVKLPRLTGYLLVGLGFGPSVLNLVTPAMANQIRLVNGLAVALIAFSAGMELDIASLRGKLRGIVGHGAWLLALLFLGLLALTLALTPVLPFTAGSPWPQRIAISLVLAAVMSTFSPTVAMAVLAETRAKGPVSERILQLVILGDLGVILIFTGATTAARVLDGTGVDLYAAARHVSWEVTGSIAVGLAAGVGVYAYRRWVNHRTSLVLAGVCLVLAEVGSRIGLSPLIACLAAGFVARNAAPDAAHEMEELIGRVRLPVLVVFFAAAGASLHLHHFVTLAPLAVGLAVARAGLIFGSNRIAANRVRLAEPMASEVPFGLISQAGVSLGLAVIVGREFGTWGKTLETLFVATISLHELIGPILFRNALQRVGEIPSSAEATEAEPAHAAG